MHIPNDRARQKEDDLVVVETPKAERNIAGMRGRYELKNWRDANGERREFPCRVKKMTSGVIEIDASVTGSIGEWVIVIFDGFGRFEGPIVRVVQRGFAMRIVTTVDDRKKIGGKIAWVENKGVENRRHERLIPSNPQSTVHADGNSVPCQVIDYSMSGAAVAADTSPELGTMLIVGKIVGRVTRRFAEGFAVEFLALRNPHDVGDLFVKSDDQ